MFSSTVFQVVKSLGASSLCGVQSITTTKDIVPFGIVIKESRRWFLLWKKFRNYSTEFHLNDVIEGQPLELDTLMSTKELVVYTRSSKFSLKGKFGVDLKKDLVDLGLKGDDTVTIQADLGELDQTDVEISDFLKLLEGRKINVHHPLIASLMKDSDSKTMCLITSVIRLKKDATLTCLSDRDFSESSGANVGDKIAKVDEDVEVDNSKTKKMLLPAGTPLAYGVHELKVDMTSGQVALVPHHAGSGGFISSLDTDVTDSPEEMVGASVSDSQTDWSLESFLEVQPEAEREALRQAVISLLREIRVIAPLMELVQQAMSFMETNVEKISSSQYMEEKLGRPPSIWQDFLLLAGFSWQEGQIVYPEEQTDVFQACEFLLSLLDFLDGATMGDIRPVLLDLDHLHFISSLLKRAWLCEGEELPLEAEEVNQLHEAKAGMTLLADLHIKVKDACLVIPPTPRADIHAVYLAVTSLTPSSILSPRRDSKDADASKEVKPTQNEAKPDQAEAVEAGEKAEAT